MRLMEPLVTIVVPSFGKGRFLDETLRSVATQTYPSWRAVIVENGSVDDSREIARGWVLRDERMILVDASDGPRNGSYCRNLGLSHAQGKHVLFLDADDVLARECLERRLGLAATDPERDLWVFSTGTFLEVVGDREKVWQPERRHPLRSLLAHKLNWHTSGTLWNTEHIRQLGGFDEGYSRLQDVEMHIRGLVRSERGYAVSNRGVPDAFYRVSDARFVNSPRAMLMDYVKSGLRLLEQIPGELGIAGLLHERVFLSGTVLALMGRLDSGVRNTIITNEEAQSSVCSMFEIGRGGSVWPPGVDKVLRMYWFAGRFAARRIRGVNGLFRGLVMKLAKGECRLEVMR